MAAQTAGKKTALILSGGGATGAYEIGVDKALFQGRSPATRPTGSTNQACIPLDPDIFTGTSIGSYNASYMVSRWAEVGASSVDELEYIWLNKLAAGKCGNGGYRIRLNPMELFNPFCYVSNPLRPVMQFANDSIFLGWDSINRLGHAVRSTEPLLERVLELVNLSSFVSTDPWERLIVETIDFERIRSAKKALRVVATNWNKGKVRIFRKAELSPDFGPKAILASSSLPGFYPPVPIGTQQFVDGGVLMNTPLKPAIQAGAELLYVINMNSAILNVPLASPPNTADTMYRMNLVGWAAALDRDINRVRAYNRAIAICEGRPIKNMNVNNLATAIHQVQKGQREGKQYKQLTIHRFFPVEPLGSILGLLNLEPDHLKTLMEKGFNDALHHDCKTMDCVLPE